MEIAERIKGYTQPSIWAFLAALTQEMKSANLGQGFPDYQIPSFFQTQLSEQILSNHQYSRSFGALPLIETLIEFYKPYIKQPLNADKIVVVNGGVQGLFDIFLGLLNNGDEVILFDPSYDCYRPEIQMGGGVARSVPLIPPVPKTKEQVKNQNYQFTDSDEWKIDWDLLEKTINDKTKIILINSPHNPTGKIFQEEELQRIAKLIQNHPKIIVLEDSVYEHLSFQHQPFNIPRMINILEDRTVVVCSAGKLFSATGLRIGWVIGNEKLILGVRSIHQYNTFCINSGFQIATANGLKESQKNNYFVTSHAEMIERKNKLLRLLCESELDVDIYVPNGGYFVIIDISRQQVKEQYFENGKYLRDFAYVIQLQREKKVASIPITPFYGSQEASKYQNFVRLAFCKCDQTVEQAFVNLKNN